MEREIKFRVWDNFHKKMITEDVSMYASLNDNGSLNTNGGLCVNKPMQYSGLKDKNGKEIYEGDYYSKGNIVEFSFGSFNINGDVPLGAICSQIEIIGNIYENPELK